MPRDNLIGMRFGYLTVTAKADGKSKWLVKCQCGTEKTMRSDSFKSGKVISCGCFARAKNTKHGASRHGLYSIWSNIVRRCTVPTNPGFQRYGGRGISICERWANSVNAFIEDMGERPQSASIERINNDGPYSPENCRWATKVEQAQNRRSSKLLTMNGSTKPLIEWSRITGIKRETIKSRLEQGWSVDRALSQPARRGNYHGPTKSID